MENFGKMNQQLLTGNLFLSILIISLKVGVLGVVEKAPPIPPTPKYEDNWVSIPIKKYHDEFFDRLFKMLLEKGIFFNSKAEREKSPFNFKKPEDLLKILEKEMRLGKKPASQSDLLKTIEKMIDLTPHVSHPFYLHRRVAGIDPYGMMGDWIVSVMHGVMLNYLFSPVYTLTEYEIYQNVRDLVGYPSDGGDGIGLPSQGHSNSYAIQLALQNQFARFKQEGIYGVKFAIFVSKAAHFTTEKWAAFEGIGTGSVIRVDTGIKGRMCPLALKYAVMRAKQNGTIPLIIIATAGTPVLGSIDPLDAIGKVAKEFGIWYHVDGHCGGALMLSDKYREKLKGVEKSDSFSWSPDCLTSMPISSNVLVTKQHGILQKTFGLGYGMFYNTTALYNRKIDEGDRTLQTSRRADLFKIWLAWKAKGKKGLANHIDYIYENLQFMIKDITKRSKFVLILCEYDTPFISFYYIPSSLMKDDDATNPSFKTNMDVFTDKLQQKLLKLGLMQIGISSSKVLPFPNKNTTPNFFTINLSNSALTKEDLVYIADKIEEIGENLDIKDKGKIKIPDPPKKYPDFVTAPIADQHKKLFTNTFKLLRESGLYFAEKRKEPPILFSRPKELKGKMDFHLGNDSLGEDKIFDLLKNTIKYQAHQTHPFWLPTAGLSSGAEPYTMAADIVSSTLTSTLITYEDSPVFTLVENEVVRAVHEMIHYPKNADGFVTTGGSLGNIHSMVLARNKKFPHLAKEGLDKKVNGKKLAVFISKDAHYSLFKAAYFTGIGKDNCFLVETDQIGRMTPLSLKELVKKSIKDGFIPYYVAATSGTSTFGEMDPLDEIAEICKEFDLWLHIDGAFGGSVIFSVAEAGILNGIEKSDSFLFNPTKMLGASFTISVFVTRHENLLSKSFGLKNIMDFDIKNEVSTLYNRDFDNGDKHLQTNRRADMFKFWLLWKAKGTEGLGKHIDRGFENSNFAQEFIMQQPNFEMILPRFFMTNVCFYYIPERLQDMDRHSPEFRNEMLDVSIAIQTQLFQAGITFIVIQFEDESALFLKFIFSNSGIQKADIEFLVKYIAFIAKDL